MGGGDTSAASAGRGVVFWDFDGTLAFREGLWRSALISALDEVDPGHGVTSEQLRSGLRDGFPWHRPEVAHVDLDTADVWWAQLEPLFVSAYRSAGVGPALAAAAAQVVPAVYTDPRFWTVFEDTRPTLAALRAAGFRSIVLSNHVPELGELIEALGLADLIDGVLTSAMIGYEKPNPAAFIRAMRYAGEPTTAWMVGDNPIADVAGAEAVGLRALLVRTTPPGGEARQLCAAVRAIISDPA